MLELIATKYITMPIEKRIYQQVFTLLNQDNLSIIYSVDLKKSDMAEGKINEP